MGNTYSVGMKLVDSEDYENHIKSAETRKIMTTLRTHGFPSGYYIRFFPEADIGFKKGTHKWAIASKYYIAGASQIPIDKIRVYENRRDGSTQSIE